MSASPRHLDLTTGSVPALVRRLALPAALGFFFNTMFNVVDTYFAGRLSTEALAALALSFPVFFLVFAVGSGFATGTTALVGHALGAGDRPRAALVGAQGLVLALAVGILVAAMGYVALPPLYRALGAQGDYLALCLAYMRVILPGSVYATTATSRLKDIERGTTRDFYDWLARKEADAPKNDGAVTDSAIDGNPNVCPAQCSSCDIPSHTCKIDCAVTSCNGAVVCPPGWNCDVACSTTGSCRNGVTCTGTGSCKIACSGANSCRDLQCGSGKCDITCTGSTSCRNVACSPSCGCDVKCSPGVAACEGVSCTAIQCDTGLGCSSTNVQSCDTCP